MVASAPRIDPRLRRVARRLGRRNPLSAAEIHRKVGMYAEQIGAFRPSYEQIRLVVNQARLQQAVRRATAQLLLEIDLGVRSPLDLLQLLEE